MSFWSDSSPIVKVAIVVGVIGIIISGLAYLQVGPFNPHDGEEVSQQRGLAPAQ